MHRQDRTGLVIDSGLNLIDIEVEGRRIDIDKNRGGADIGNRLCGRDKGEGGGDDFVTGADPGGAQGQV